MKTTTRRVWRRKHTRLHVSDISMQCAAFGCHFRKLPMIVLEGHAHVVCGLGALAMWPWVVQTAELGFCECIMAQWELICWQSEWISTGHRYLRW